MDEKIEIVGSDGKKVSLQVKEAIVQIAKALLGSSGASSVAVRVDALHDATLSLHWSPKETAGRDPREHTADHDCG